MLSDVRLIDLFISARHIMVLTGAGVSAESGVPTFRGAQGGFWGEIDPADIATPEGFERDPEMVTRWYDQRRCELVNCFPNAGHLALSAMQEKALAAGRKFTVITQNVDGLHQAAGSADVSEIHGSLWNWRCTKCGVEAEEVGPAFETYPPMCACGGMRRPSVVWFGEPLPEEANSRAKRAANTCDFFLSLGTSGMVFPAAKLIDRALRRRVPVVEINLEETPYSRRVQRSIRGRTGEVLPGLLASVSGARAALTSD